MFVRKKESETIGSLMYRFSKKVQQSGILREAKKRRFYVRAESRAKRKQAAIYQEAKKREVAKAKKLGIFK